MSYTYDALHRLKTAVTAGSAQYAQWGLTWTYDRYGRFSSPDPLAGSTADPQSLNRYTYVLNDPVDKIDPLGLLTCQVDNVTVACTSAFFNILETYLSHGGTVTEMREGPYITANIPLTKNATIVGVRFLESVNLQHGGLVGLCAVYGICPIPEGGGTTGDGGSDGGLTDPGSVKAFAENVAWDLNVSIGFVAVTGAYHPRTNTSCVGVGPGYGFTLNPLAPVSASFGPLVLGNISDAADVLSGWNISGSGQMTPTMGAQWTGNRSGSLGGPTVGTPGAAISLTYSICF